MLNIVTFEESVSPLLHTPTVIPCSLSLQVTFPKRKIITDITVQRGYSSAHNAYIKEYKVKYSECKWQTHIEDTAWNIWKEYKEQSTPRVRFFMPFYKEYLYMSLDWDRQQVFKNRQEFLVFFISL